MRLIQLIAGYGQGGTDRVAWNLAAGLRAAGHEVVTAANAYWLNFHGVPAPDDAHWLIPRFRGLPLRELLAFNRRARSADVVLAHDSGARHFGLYAKLLGLRPPLWFMRHCISGTSRFGGVQLHRLCVARQIAVSDVIRRSLAQSGYPEARLHRIFGGVDLQPFQQPDAAAVAENRRRLLADAPPGALVLGMVARLDTGRGWTIASEDTKGYDLLFKALARVTFPYRVLVLGPDWDGAFPLLRQMAALHGARPDWLAFGGFVRDIANYYPLMDVTVLPSRAEGLGLSVIESLAAGVATVGSRGGGIEEILEHERTGLLFDRGDAAGFAACLERLAGDAALRQTLARRGQAEVLARFDAPVMVRAFGQLLEQTAARPA